MEEDNSSLYLSCFCSCLLIIIVASVVGFYYWSLTANYYLDSTTKNKTYFTTLPIKVSNVNYLIYHNPIKPRKSTVNFQGPLLSFSDIEIEQEIEIDQRNTGPFSGTFY